MTTKQPTPDAKLGLLLLGRYRIVRKLGEGGMGAVYEGQHELIGKRLAIKCLHAQFASNPEIVERFYREAQAATSVGNEHIIEVTDVGTFDDDSPFLVMEYLDGVELTKVIEHDGSMPISRLVHIATQVCSALAAAHARGIVHRDMKPENIFLIRRGHDSDFVKVLDFGISKMRESNEALGPGLTRTGMALGTPYYMAPEQAQGIRDIDQRADIYSVGVMLYQALTGNLPFDAESYPALLLKIMTDRPAPMRAFRNDVPEALEQVVLKAMARDRKERFQTIEDLSQALAPFAVLHTLPGSQVPARGSSSAMPQTTPFVTVHEQQAGVQPSASGARAPRDLRMPIGVALGVVALGAIALVLSRGPLKKEDHAGAHVVVPAQAIAAPVKRAPQTAHAAQPVEPAPVAPALPAHAQEPVREAGQIAREVQVKISASPSEAKIFIGDVEFPNPMDAYRPRSLDPIRIRVEARGHQAIEQLAIFDQNRQLSFSLAAGRGVRRLDAMGMPQATEKPVQAAVEPTAVPAPEPEAPPKPEATDGIYHGPTGKLREDF